MTESHEPDVSGVPPAEEPEVFDVEVVEADQAAPAATSSEGDPLDEALAEVLERTNDLQRLQAEFLNYKRRVDRDRDLIAQNATIKALSPVIEVLDAIDLARGAGDVEGGFKAVVEQLERAVASSGLLRFGEVGDAFDPTRHEALSIIGEDPEVAVTTIKVVARAGYRIGERIVRAAQVLVVEPGAGQAGESTTG